MAPTGPYTIVKFTGHSDGDETHRPKSSDTIIWKLADPELYLTKLAQKYEEEMGRAITGKSWPFLLISVLFLLTDPRLGVRYRLKQLPPGYEVWARSRPNGERVC